MATTQDVITAALRRIRVVDMLDDPPAEYSAHALKVLNALIAAWAGAGMATDDQLLAANYANGSKVVTGLGRTSNVNNTDALVVGMYVTGTGIPTNTRIESIDDDDQVTLTEAATANGAGETLTFTILPLDDSLEQAIVAVLAVRLAEEYGMAIGPILTRDARFGEDVIAGQYFRIKPTQFDQAIVQTPGTRFYRGIGTEEIS